jgi:hypothetical protein
MGGLIVDPWSVRHSSVFLLFALSCCIFPVGLLLLLGSLASNARFDQNFQIKGLKLFCFGLRNRLINGRQMNNLTACFISPVAAVKIPKIYGVRKRLPAFSLYLLFNFVFDGFDKPWNFDLWVGHFKSFFHGDSNRCG